MTRCGEQSLSRVVSTATQRKFYHFNRYASARSLGDVGLAGYLHNGPYLPHAQGAAR